MQISKTKYASQYIDNMSFDDQLKVRVTEIVGADGVLKNPATEETLAGTMSIAVDDTSTAGVTYVGKAVIGSSSASVVWQIKKIYDDSTPSQWADGNSNFDNIWSNRLSLTYA